MTAHASKFEASDSGIVSSSARRFVLNHRLMSPQAPEYAFTRNRWYQEGYTSKPYF